MNTTDKLDRILEIFLRAIKGEDISVKKLSLEYGVSPKTISRDISDLRSFMADKRELLGYADLVYSHAQKAYRFHMDEFLSNKELLYAAKILIASRALNRDDMTSLIHKLERLSTPDNREMMHLGKEGSCCRQSRRHAHCPWRAG